MCSFRVMGLQVFDGFYKMFRIKLKSSKMLGFALFFVGYRAIIFRIIDSGVGSARNEI